VIGGVLYTYADHRLGDLSGSHAVSTLPGVLRTPLSEPLFVLGVLFVLVVFFVPGGLVRIGRVKRPRTLQRLSAAARTAPGDVA
jgi:branched-chain amino acid transport system permease protein